MDKSEEEEEEEGEEERLDGDRDWSDKLGFLTSGDRSVVSCGCARTVTNTLLPVLLLLMLGFNSSSELGSKFELGTASSTTAVLLDFS